MSEYSSNTNLLPLNHKEKYPRQQTTRGKNMKVKGGGNGSGSNVCNVMMMILLMLGIVSIGFIGAIYITHLQQVMRELELRVQALESRPCSNGKEDKQVAIGQADEEPDIDMYEQIKSRIKREVADAAGDESEESPHHRADHHGIGSHNIALVFGDADNIRLKSDPDGAKSHKFKIDRDSPNSAECGILYTRGDGQKWCTPLHNNSDEKVNGKYMTSRGEHQYFYFKKASWMNRPRAIANFNLTHDGRITVHRSGIYIVHASLHFRDINQRGAPQYGVYKSDGLGFRPKMVSKCVVTPADTKDDDDGTGVYPCQAWQLVHLNAGDQVFMSIGGYSWFEVEKETFHLALIKLNNFEL